MVSAHELYACGLRPDAVTARVRRGHLHRLYRGVYAVGHTNLTLEGRFLAAVKACGPGAVLSHLSAAILFGLMDPVDRLIDVTIEGTSTRTHPGIRVRRAAVLDARTTTRHRGIPTTTPLKTLHDSALDTTHKGLVRLDRRTVRPDLRWPKQRPSVEADSRTWHAGAVAQAEDAERQALLEAHGERVVRVTWEQAVARPQQTIARLRSAGAPERRPRSSAARRNSAR